MKIKETFNKNWSHNLWLKREMKKEKPLFILASGPSLKDCDVTKLKDCYTMSFNRSYIAFEDWGFEPTYFAGLDHVVNADNREEYRKLIDSSDIQRFFFSKDKSTEEYLSSKKTSIVEIEEGDPTHPNLNFNGKLTVSNSGLFGLQVAIGLLHFREIYLLGCDANYQETVKGVKFVNGVYVSQSDSDPNHFRKDYYGTGRTYNKPGSLIWHLPAWKWFWKTFVKNNDEIKVYNCSKTGKLTFFEFKDFEEIAKNISQYEIHPTLKI